MFGNIKSDSTVHKETTSNLSNHNDEQTFGRYFNNIKRKLIKKSYYLNHINQFKSHLENNTVPKELLYTKFPIPFLWDDEEFVKKHNQLIQDF